MLKALLLPLRTALGVLMTASLLMACEGDSETEPMPEVGPSHTSFSLVDSIKVNAAYRNMYPEAYDNLRGKTYKVATQDKLEAYFYEDANGVTLYFRDTSTVDARSWVSLQFKNRTLLNLPETLSLKDASTVCVHNGQTFSDGSGAMSPGCVAVLDGTVNLQYNPSTHVLSGGISNLKMGLEYYVPEYSFPNRAGIALKNSGSSRNLNITFQNIKDHKNE
ncbi:hypothetical protein [Rufibacter latericius]|uniref:LPS export ABC transporter periplasmic protein LptC n=1 Tax=Rufibacter latericius TaxID=2487040 RepID=A0A3M9MD19_9BACT|nr:hypothetical protein [Rufibacter latericius]RNI22488.1 hypothetical protein EFB08_20520 [Rufibacter latericius]